jgi:hypothetical protein
MMQSFLGEDIGRNIQFYIDDVVITAKLEATLINYTRETFYNLDRYHTTLNPAKCFFGIPAGQLLGYLISAREANLGKILAILKRRKLANVKDIQ